MFCEPTVDRHLKVPLKVEYITCRVAEEYDLAEKGGLTCGKCFSHTWVQLQLVRKCDRVVLVEDNPLISQGTESFPSDGSDAFNFEMRQYQVVLSLYIIEVSSLNAGVRITDNIT
jgi:hypothetical protein